MRHYVVVFLESQLFPGTWVTDHFVRREEREEVPALPETLPSCPHGPAIKLLKEWQNEHGPDPAWTLEECLLGGVAQLTAIWYGDKGRTPKRIVRYWLESQELVIPG